MSWLAARPERFLSRPERALGVGISLLAVVVLMALVVPAGPLAIDERWSEAMHDLRTPLLTDLALVFRCAWPRARLDAFGHGGLRRAFRATAQGRAPGVRHDRSPGVAELDAFEGSGRPTASARRSRRTGRLGVPFRSCRLCGRDLCGARPPVHGTRSAAKLVVGARGARHRRYGMEPHLSSSPLAFRRRRRIVARDRSRADRLRRFTTPSKIPARRLKTSFSTAEPFDERPCQAEIRLRDYSLNLGDPLRLRILDHATGRFRVAGFHVVGVVQEFPSAPNDSFMVANLSYLERITHDRGPNVLFVRASGDPPALARRVATATARHVTIVKDIRNQTAETVSSITTVDLRGISRIEEAFVLVLATATMALQFAVALAERRQELATMAALGASLRQTAAFLWSEAALVLRGSSRACRSPRLAARRDARRDASARLRSAAGSPCDPVGLPRRAGAAAALGGLAAATAAAARLRRLPLGAILREE